ncbi:MAG: 50S ribosomal protein L23 [Bacteroidales bacterium]|nr:50S ribosomal protein L23 [Bacteroidales bacterium]
MEIIKKPVITEKMTELGDRLNQYAFIVDRSANKIMIRDAVEQLYDVKVIRVNTMNFDGKAKSRVTKGGYITGSTNAFKKAIVTLAEGETIDFFSNI